MCMGMTMEVLYILDSQFEQNMGTQAPATAGVHAISCTCVGLMNNSFADNQGIGVAIDDSEGGCEVDSDGETLPYPPLFNRSTIAYDDTDFLDTFFDPTSIESACVDIRNCSFVRNVDASFLGPVDSKDVATQLRGGAGVSLMKNTRGFLADLHFEDNKGFTGWSNAPGYKRRLHHPEQHIHWKPCHSWRRGHCSNQQ